MMDTKLIRLAYYESHDGPRIILFGPLQVDLKLLQNCFYSLSRGEGPIDLENQSFVHTTAGFKLRLQCSGKMFDKENRCILSQGLHKIAENTFLWSRNQEGWDYLAELIDGLISSTTDGHQYLTRYPDEDAIIVLSKGEYTDDVLDN